MMLRIYKVIPEDNRKELFVLIGLLIFYSLLEVLGIASIAPFVAISTTKDIHSIQFVKNHILPLGITDKNSILILAASVFITITVIANIFKFFTSRKLFRYSTKVNEALSFHLIKSYLHRPYSFFLMKNSSELSKNLLVEVNHFTKGILVPWLELISKTVISSCILIFLFVTNLKLSSILFLSSLSIYFLLTLFFRKKIKLMGEQSKILNKQRFKVATESFVGIKDIKILNKENIFINEFKLKSEEYADIRNQHNSLSVAPRYFVEAFAFASLVATILYLNITSEDASKTISTIALFAFAGFRLLPSLQAIYNAMANIRFTLPTMAIIETDVLSKQEIAQVESGYDPVEFNESIILENVSFQYETAKAPSLKKISMTIRKNSTIGIVGQTGAGKSTMIDLLTALLTPTHGNFLIDGKPLHQTQIKAWQSQIGYVAQNVYLSDDTISANIAFGVPKDKIDMTRVKECAEAANLGEFITTILPKQYDTVVGDRGVRLSGGQRQRIAIARSLYRNPSVLIFDEATSSLDTKTESSIIEAINNLAGKKTIIMIAHRLTTVSNCDKIFVIHNGMIQNSGDYSYLQNHCETFQELLKSKQ